MIIKEITPTWFMVKGRGLCFFGSNKAEVMSRATWHLALHGGASA